MYIQPIELVHIQHQLTQADNNYEQARTTLAETLDLTRVHRDLQQAKRSTTKNARQDSPAGDTPNPLGVDEGQGSCAFTLVEIRGLKPRTSALPALRSNQLSYIPIVKKVHSLVLFCIKLKKPSLKKSKINVKTLPCQPRH